MNRELDIGIGIGEHTDYGFLTLVYSHHRATGVDELRRERGIVPREGEAGAPPQAADRRRQCPTPSATSSRDTML